MEWHFNVCCDENRTICNDCSDICCQSLQLFYHGVKGRRLSICCPFVVSSQLGANVKYLHTVFQGVSWLNGWYFRFPFDTKQPLAYSVASILQFLFTACISTITAVCVAVGLGTFLLAISLTKDIQNDFILINKNAKSKRKRGHALKQLSELIQYHASAKQLSEPLLFELHLYSMQEYFMW